MQLLNSKKETNISLVPFTYLWWLAVGKRAYHIAETYAHQSHYYVISDYCIFRAEACQYYKR